MIRVAVLDDYARMAHEFADWSLLGPGAETTFLHEKISEALGLAFSFFGMLASYAVGLLPSLIICTAFAKIRRHISAVGLRLVAAAVIGAAVYFLAFVLGLDLLTAGRMERAYWLFTFYAAFYAAAAGAVSAFICVVLLSQRISCRSCTFSLTLRSGRLPPLGPSGYSSGASTIGS